MFPRSRVLKVDAKPVAEVLDEMGVPSDAFAGRVALVTGGARGIGEQAARGLAALGARVTIADIRDEEGEAVAESIREAGHTARFICTDIAYERNVERLVDRITRADGPIEILLNNAVQIDVQSVLETSTELWDYTLETNVRAPFLLIRALLPGMLERGTGTIANMIALEGMAYSAAMSASKVALRSLVISLCDELPRDCGVSIFGFAPGLVATDMVLDVFPRYAERVGVDFEEFVFSQTHNPGYEGLMPAEHAGAGLVHALLHGSEHHGLFTTPYGPLARAGIIERGEQQGRPRLAGNASRLRDYINEIHALDETIEDKIRRRTEQLEEQSARAQSLAAVGMLASGVAHEINNPLTYVMANLEGAIESVAERPEELREILSEALTGVQRIRSIVADMKLMSRMEQDDELQRIDLHDVLDRTLRVVSADLRHRARLVKDYGEIPAVVASETRLIQVFVNLLVNAGHAIEPGHANDNEIRISTRGTPGEQATVIIHDTGKGMAPEVVDKVFEPFFTTKGKGEGTGLGLAICQGIVDKLGGSIDVVSELGEGTSFRVSLPAAATSDERRATSGGDERRGRLDRAQILLVDDDPIICRAVTRLLDGHDVTVVHSGREALQLLLSSPGFDAYDLVLCDVMMADVTGIEVYQAVLEDHPEGSSRFVFLTGGALTAEGQRFLERPGVRVLTKPFRKDELHGVVAEALRWTRRRRKPSPLRLVSKDS